tara:strand:- start:109 stop:543 length:435 start_codon:yes stop_codon:yes gene_type:complete
MGKNIMSKITRAGRTVAPEARTSAAKAMAKKRVELENIIRDGDPDSKAVKEAKEKIARMDKLEAEQNAARRAKQSAAARKDKDVPLPKLKSEMNKGGAVKKPAMMRGGMANGKAHMYAAGGSVMDNLTAGQKRMVRAMAADNKK